MQPVAKIKICGTVSSVETDSVDMMLPIALNHMTAPALPTEALFGLAASLGMVGVELRNDLGRPMFDGAVPEAIRDMAQAHGLRILALAEVKAFNDPVRNAADDAAALAGMARRCGAEAIALIPKVAAAPTPRDEQRKALADALANLLPVLDSAGITGLIEPLGFPVSTLRHKEDVAEVLEQMGTPPCFRIVHDTFHHHLAGGGPVFAALTGLVHISGVIDPAPTPDRMTDAHRVLVDTRDRLHTIAQLRALTAAGYAGPASFEAFAPEIHALSDPAAALTDSQEFILSSMTGIPA